MTYFEESYPSVMSCFAIASIYSTLDSRLHRVQYIVFIDVSLVMVFVQWKCLADLPLGLSFGAVDVSCEGYAYPDDPYILDGSCGLEYELIDNRRGRLVLSLPNQNPDSACLHLIP